jgi:hypothetical protein
MMRSKACVLIIPLIVMLAVPSPSHAATATIVQTIQGLHQFDADVLDIPVDFNALPFNPALGVLQDVTLEMIGTYTPRFIYRATRRWQCRGPHLLHGERYPDLCV